MVKDELAAAITQALTDLSVPNILVTLEHPADMTHGDYATNAALAAAKIAHRNPQELANDLAARLQEAAIPGVERITVAGPGFINFFLNSQYFRDELARLLTAGEVYGRSEIGRGQKVIAEYSSPNIAKPFSIGHLRSTIIGNAIANILDFSGYHVIRDNHLGDWGTQFGKLIVALERWGDLAAVRAAVNPVKELVALYVRFHHEAETDPTLEDEARARFAQLEAGDPEMRQVWQACVDVSLGEFERIYQRLGMRFDTRHGESFFGDKMAPALAALEHSGLLKESDGAKLVFFSDDALPPFMILKRDGSSLYSLRDLAADFWRRNEYGDDVVIINGAGAEQTLHFKQLYETERLLGWFTSKQRVHVAHGLYRFKDAKMSTRKGNVIWLEDVINEIVRRAEALNPETAEAAGIGALLYNDLKRESIKEIIFDWDEVLNLNGNSGPYLQYAHARVCSLEERAGGTGVAPDPTRSPVEELLRLLVRFPEVVARAAAEYAPHHLATYLYELASSFNAFYNQEQILDGTPEATGKLALALGVGQVLKNGLKLLGIQAPRKM